MPRLFVGVPIPALAGFEDVQRRLSGARALKPVRLDQTHVTLKFLGHVPDAKVEAVHHALGDALAGAAAHDAEAAGVGAFPSLRSARVVWVGLECTTLPAVAAAIEEACMPLGFEREKRAFTAHVTLARLRDPQDLTERLTPVREHRFGPVRIAEVVLFESTLSSAGPDYRRLHTWTLLGEAHAAS